MNRTRSIIVRRSKTKYYGTNVTMLSPAKIKEWVNEWMNDTDRAKLTYWEKNLSHILCTTNTHWPVCEQSPLYTRDVSEKSTASIFRASCNVSCYFPATLTSREERDMACSLSMPSWDRGSTWQHGCGPEGKISERGLLSLSLSLPLPLVETRSQSLYSRCSQLVASQYVCLGGFDPRQYPCWNVTHKAVSATFKIIHKQIQGYGLWNTRPSK